MATADNTTHKRCSKCQTRKKLEAYYKDASRPDGLNPYCKPCLKDRRRSPTYRISNQNQSRKFRQQNPDKVKIWDRQRPRRIEVPAKLALRRRKIWLKRLYGATLEDYEKLFVAQNGLCSICQKPETFTQLGKVTNLSIDHCHQTGKVRGLLCRKCNFLIGQANDDPKILLEAVRYLERAS
jgi:hypothetical protein